MQITEIYRSLQGESSYTGIPCIFVRLTACNLRCSWCDSEYTFTGGRKMSIDEVEAEVHNLAPSGLVEITGGEPMLQERELIPLMERLIDKGYKLLIETSGERPLASVPKAVVKIVDVKCPGSGHAGSFRLENLGALTPHDEIKFVIADRADYDFARDFTRQHDLAAKVSSVIFSPAFRKDARGTRDASHCLVDPEDLANWILADRLEVRLGLQAHKFIWAPETKGV
ncbi:MAG TPA: radical SAM protein [Candidatus Koribacter sp.]|jgi:7-carboxy-7-deazaguanine synthase